MKSLTNTYLSLTFIGLLMVACSLQDETSLVPKSDLIIDQISHSEIAHDDTSWSGEYRRYMFNVTIVNIGEAETDSSFFILAFKTEIDLERGGGVGQIVNRNHEVIGIDSSILDSMIFSFPDTTERVIFKISDPDDPIKHPERDLPNADESDYENNTFILWL